jgi:chitodextrinase
MTNIQINSNKSIPEVKKGYIDYLGTFNWNTFITGTTKYELTLPSARRLVERWYNTFNHVGTALFWVAEKYEVKDGHHIHALLQGNVPYRQLIDNWQWATGNKSDFVSAQGDFKWHKDTWNRIDIQKYDNRRKAGGYVSKYVFKKHADYDLLYC